MFKFCNRLTRSSRASFRKTETLFTEESSEKFRYSVGFFVNDEGHLQPVREPAFCFFPTKEVTGLNFIIHALFLLTDSREGIRAGIPHNDNMIHRLADLSAQALLHFKSIGEQKGQRCDH